MQQDQANCLQIGQHRMTMKESWTQEMKRRSMNPRWKGGLTESVLADKERCIHSALVGRDLEKAHDDG